MYELIRRDLQRSASD